MNRARCHFILCPTPQIPFWRWQSLIEPCPCVSSSRCLTPTSPPPVCSPPCFQVSDGDERVDRGSWQLRRFPATFLGGQPSALFRHHTRLWTASSHQAHRVELQVGRRNPPTPSCKLITCPVSFIFVANECRTAFRLPSQDLIILVLVLWIYVASQTAISLQSDEI